LTAHRKEEPMNATTCTLECTATIPTLFLAFELGSTTRVVACASSPAQRPRVRRMPAGDLRTLTHEILTAKARLGLAWDAPVQSCYEAGRDGFWLHRWLAAQGIANVVVDSSSIEVNRRARQAKTDRLDVRKLLHLLQRWAGGERKVWSIVRVPTVADEAARQLSREIATVREDRKRVRNRIQGLLATQGVRLALTPRFVTQLATLQTGDGSGPLPAALCERLAREWGALETIEARLTQLTTLRALHLDMGTDRVAQVARRLCHLRGLAATGAATLSAELFGTREFQNGRQLGALVGLVPVPYRSDQRVQDQGISKAGRTELRRLAMQLAWGWIRWQPDSALTQWFQRRFAGGGGRSRRIGIVAVARKLLIALWRFIAHGVVPDGARLKSAA
jgi:transposase